MFEHFSDEYCLDITEKHTMNFGEYIELNEKGEVYGTDTGRLIAKFSHYSEALSFVTFYNKGY